MELIAQGAEAKLFKDGSILIKHRIKKDYRIKEIDLPLRQFRTRRESKILQKLEALKFPAPKLLKFDDKDMKIEMEFIDGKKLADHLEKLDYKKICWQIGERIAVLHKNDVIHGDLTTSNMILKGGTVYFIDFGLSFFSRRAEDKAVDLHLVKQALESKHYTIWEDCFKEIAAAYSDKEVLARLEKVEGRGRYKSKH
jgi:TP53 regulating kinase-like protein